MRRIRKVQVAVSENFYRLLNEQKQKAREDMKRITGFDKDISFVNLTELMARKFPKQMNLIKNVKQKSRCI